MLSSRMVPGPRGAHLPRCDRTGGRAAWEAGSWESRRAVGLRSGRVAQGGVARPSKHGHAHRVQSYNGGRVKVQGFSFSSKIALKYLVLVYLGSMEEAGCKNIHILLITVYKFSAFGFEKQKRKQS